MFSQRGTFSNAPQDYTAATKPTNLQVGAEGADMVMEVNKCYGTAPLPDDPNCNDVYSTIPDVPHPIIPGWTNECHDSAIIAAPIKVHNATPVNASATDDPVVSLMPAMIPEDAEGYVDVLESHDK